MRLDLSLTQDRRRFRARCRQLLSKECVVELAEKKGRNPVRRNSYLHLILSWCALETGHSLEFVKEYYFKRVCNPDIFLRRVTDRHIGEVEVVRSTRFCTDEEISIAIENFRTWATDHCGIFIPPPTDYQRLREVDIEINQNEEYI